METSFHHNIDSPPEGYVYDDEELAVQLLAEELAFQSPFGHDQRQGTAYSESPQTVPVAYNTRRDLELAKMLQVREDAQSMRASTAEDSRTDLELAKMLQGDADEDMVVDCAAEDKKSDIELAKLLQQQEDIAASDFLIAKQMQEELEQDEAGRCESCGQQQCQDHPYGTHGLRRESRRRRCEAANANNRDPGYDTTHNSMLHQIFQSPFALPGRVLGGGRQFRQNTNREDYEDSDDDDDDDEDYESLLELGETIGEARPQGLAQDQMNALPTCHFNASSHSTATAEGENQSDANDCHICFCAFSNNDVLRTLPCLHRYHRDCIDQWIQRKAICPICRVEIKDHIGGGH